MKRKLCVMVLLILFMANTVYVFGDGSIDNLRYVSDAGQTVAAHLRRLASPKGWRVESRAEEYAAIADIPAQTDKGAIETPAVIVVSVGGRDALLHIDLVADPSKHVVSPRAFLEYHRIKEEFRAAYGRALDHVAAFKQPTAVCTVFNPDSPDAGFKKMVSAGLSFFNDVITEEALRRDFSIIDLRLAVANDEDYANPIRPSDKGGQRIAEEIARMVEKIGGFDLAP